MVKIRYARYAENRVEFQDKIVFDPARGLYVNACRECNEPRQGRFHFYCSPEHKEKWERENVPNGWGQMRRLILERDRERCTNCGVTEPELKEAIYTEISNYKKGSAEWWTGYYSLSYRAILEVDHIKPVKLYPELEYEESNLRTLCHECHLKLGERPSRKEVKRKRSFGHMKNLEDFNA